MTVAKALFVVLVAPFKGEPVLNSGSIIAEALCWALALPRFHAAAPFGAVPQIVLTGTFTTPFE